MLLGELIAQQSDGRKITRRRVISREKFKKVYIYVQSCSYSD